MIKISIPSLSVLNHIPLLSFSLSLWVISDTLIATGHKSHWLKLLLKKAYMFSVKVSVRAKAIEGLFCIQ